jgi:hypothetical protein
MVKAGLLELSFCGLFLRRWRKIAETPFRKMQASIRRRLATRYLRRALDEERIETNREPNHTVSLFWHNKGLPVLVTARGQYGNGVAIIPEVMTVMVIAGCPPAAPSQSISRRQRSTNPLLIGGRATAFEANSEYRCESNNRT